MMSVILLAFCSYLVLAGDAANFGGQSEALPMKKYTIDLDQSPQERWIPLLKDFKSSAPLIVKYFNDQVCAIHSRCLANNIDRF